MPVYVLKSFANPRFCEDTIITTEIQNENV